ncbi:hypothetical protein KUTeg_023963 [Tegillarca granosa]|uniref:Peroxidase n=1 Tax=Tegillarca granosa TaxID=220873 RepID=A0ABQ9E1K3_TEGGR|nr:hypothetical protein KUTeg_023963 [Tegillarca granosa]
MTQTGNLITCCDKKQPPFPEACFPIRIPADDPFFNKKCMEFVRSVPVVDNSCPCEPRQQMNEITSYIDASNVYGSTKEEVNKLRSFKHGRLLVSDGGLLPPRANQLSCSLTDPGDFCFLAGDRRLHEVPTLGSIHVTFVRYHNYLASQLKQINRHWSDERIFQEARKIIGAVMQKINYQEYLPAILNYDIRRKYCLTAECKKYNDKVDPATVNSFAVTAFRFGHSQIAGMNAFFKLVQPRSKCPYGYGYKRKRCPMSEIIELERVQTETTFQNPKLVFDNVDGLQLFQITNASLKADGEIHDSVRNKLFLDSDNNSLDLAALDIQRGRDHGIPGYTEFRKFCGLSPVKYFRSGKHGLVDHNPRNIKLLRKAYRDVRDIDLFVGAQTEEHLPHSALGPTFSCLIAEQYKRYKIGDRFWWERPDPIVGFTRGQRRALNNLRFSKIMCEMHKLSEIQPYVMLLPNQKWNRRRSCRSLPSLDLRPWKEHKNGR